MNGYLRVLCQWSRVYGEVERRLEEHGAFDSLQHLHGMSQAELDLLVERELSHPKMPEPVFGERLQWSGNEWSRRSGNCPGPGQPLVGGIDEMDANRSDAWTATA